MSSSCFDYKDNELDYLQIMVAKEIGYIEYYVSDSEHRYNPKTLDYMKEICSTLGKLAKAMHSLDRFVSGDTGEEKFISDYEKLYKDTYDG